MDSSAKGGPVTRLPLRVYADTSVFGGVFDEGFDAASRAFLETIREGRFSLVISTFVRSELEDAPKPVRECFERILPLAEIARPGLDALALRDAYMTAGIVGPRQGVDALHVAMATVARCELIVSWNFKHIVHYQKIPRYNAVNVLQGYQPIAIFSPLEVTDSEESEDV